MSRKEKPKSGQYKEVQTDTKTSAVEFVRPLIAEVHKEITTPDVDLSSPEKAANSLKELEATMEKLNQFRSRVGQLKPLLEQERYDLEK